MRNTLDHEYTEQQLDHAMGASHDITGDDDILEVSFEGIRAFLNALPDQPGEDALREQAGVYQALLEHPFFRDWSISDTSVWSFMMNKLDSAMTPQDDWEACGFADIRKGDRVKEVVDQGGGTYEITEGVADFKAPGAGRHLAWKPRGAVYELALDDYASDSHKVTLYRIPAPVVAPDPVEHPVIHVRDSDIVGFTPKIMVWYRDSYVAGRQGLSPEQITDWKPIDPAKVVADND